MPWIYVFIRVERKRVLYDKLKRKKKFNYTMLKEIITELERVRLNWCLYKHGKGRSETLRLVGKYLLAFFNCNDLLTCGDKWNMRKFLKQSEQELRIH